MIDFAKRAIAACWAFVTSWLTHDSRPPAETFEQGQRALMVKMLARAGIGATAIVVALALFLVDLVRSGAPEWQQRLALYGLLGVLGFYALTNLAIVMSFAVGGPVGRIDIEANRDGLKAGAQGRGEGGA